MMRSRSYLKGRGGEAVFKDENSRSRYSRKSERCMRKKFCVSRLRERVSCEARWVLRELSAPFGLPLPTLRSKGNLLAEETEMRVVAEKSEHDEVGVEAVQAVADVGVVVWLGLLETDALHDLVLPFSRNLQTRLDRPVSASSVLSGRGSHARRVRRAQSRRHASRRLPSPSSR